ncbi:MAG: hypothetical protein LIP09_06785 [Bacteroidales bacterium]|nr:hypothetical protein [Bacteroidales bacterium]
MKRLLLILILCVTNLTASFSMSVWDGHTTNYSWYTGASDDTYYISSAEDLAGLSKSFSSEDLFLESFKGKTLVLTDDIDLDNWEWLPIGNTNCKFDGSLDGHNHKITNLYISNKIYVTDENGKHFYYNGLFGCINGLNNNFSNLTINGTINMTSFVEDLYNWDEIFVGGFVADIKNNDINNYELTEMEPVKVSFVNCISDIDIKISNFQGGHSNIGGFVGTSNTGRIGISDNFYFEKCIAQGTILYDSPITSVIQYDCVGGFLGYNGIDNLTITNCNSSVDIETSALCIGGFVGQAGPSHYFDINNCLFNGTISVFERVNEVQPTCLVGGIIGDTFTRVNPDPIPTVKSCLVTGTIFVCETLPMVYSSPILGYIAAPDQSQYIIENCYYIEGMTNHTGYGTPVSQEELKSGTSMPGLDAPFWFFEPGAYPYLSYMEPEYLLSLALEGGYVGITLPRASTFQFQISAEENEELYQVLWNSEDITDQVTSMGVLITPKLYGNSTLYLVFKSKGGIQAPISNNKSNVKFTIIGRTLMLSDIEPHSVVSLVNREGMLLNNSIVNNSSIQFENLPHDVYIVKINAEVFKVII